MVIVFFGTPQFAVPSLEALISSPHRVALVVTQPDKRRNRGQKVTDAPVKAAARAHDLPVYQPERLRDPDVIGAIREHQPDIGVVAAYGKLIPGDLLRLPRHGMINVHASLLPRHRGAAPVHRSILNGDAETGVTIMQMVEALDAGDMLAKSRRTIASDETSEQLERELADDGARLLLEALDRIEAGTIQAEPQDESLSTYAPRLRKEEGLIDWTLSSRQIHDRVRGLYPWPHAYSHFEGARLILLKVRLKADTTPDEIRLKPDSTPAGTVLSVSRDEIEVATGSGSIAITEVQPEGKRPMTTREFLAGRAVRPGMKFGP